MRKLFLTTILVGVLAVPIAGLALVACQGASSPTAPEETIAAPSPPKSLTPDPAEPSPTHPGLPEEAGAALDQVAEKAKGPKVDVCHIPPGNLSNSHVINVSENAVDAHLAHGDNLFGNEICDGVDNDCNGIVDDGDTCEPSPLCQSDADCRLFSSYCEGCSCLALHVDEPDPTCDGEPVICFVDPCLPGEPVAVCDEVTGGCVIAP